MEILLFSTVFYGLLARCTLYLTGPDHRSATHSFKKYSLGKVGFLIGHLVAGKRKMLSSVKCVIKCKIRNALGHGNSHNVLFDMEMCVCVSECVSVCITQLHHQS